MYNYETVSKILTHTHNIQQEERHNPVSVTVTRPISSSSRSGLYSGLNNRQSPHTPHTTPPYFLAEYQEDFQDNYQNYLN